VDIICFNPPYVITESSDINSSLIAASWAGGIKGREVTDRVLPYIPVCNLFQHFFYYLN